MVASDDEKGLRVLQPDGVWNEVLLGPGRVAIIPGRTLEHALGGAVLTTTHAVALQEESERLSFVYGLAVRETALTSPAPPPALFAHSPRR